MKNLMLERLPQLESPLVKTTSPHFLNTSYKDAGNEPWFKEFGDKDRFEESKWEVNEGLEFLFDVFGEDLFMDFVKHYFNINLREKGNKPWDWVFR